MYLSEPPECILADALAELRACVAPYLPAGADRDLAEATFRRIQESEARSLALRKAVIDESSDGVFLVEPYDGGYRWLFVNDAFVDITGQAGASLVGTLLSPSADCGWARTACADAISACAAVKFDHKLDRPDRKLELQTSVTPIYDASGSCVRLVGVMRDVTEQKTAERLLRKQNRRLQNILGCISDGFVVVDRDWRITFVNGRAERMLGSSRAALTGACVFDSLPDLRPNHAGDSADLLCARPPSAAGGEPEGRWITARMFPSQEGTAIYLQDVSERKQAEHALKQVLARVQASLDGVVNAMAFVVEMRDPYTGGHQRRVSALACAIAREMGFPSDRVETMRIAGLLHDVGKISIPAEILNRPGKLSEAERIIIRTHAQIGYEILKEIEFASPVALIALQHHERLDGSGYPQGLQAETIIPEARILAIADVVEAMASHRPYRAALGVEIALQEVMSFRGVRYDDEAVDACLSVFTESGFDFDQLMLSEVGRRADDAEAQLGGALN